jgi:phosphoribosylaminoimidazolecarboxamide formyltransferase/IMP cyclohydrolase
VSTIAVRRALISVYDKTGLDELARGLHEAGVEIVSTGSTAAYIRDLGVRAVWLLSPATSSACR